MSPPSTAVERALWKTLRGGAGWATLGWLAWVGVASGASVLLVDRVGPAGIVATTFAAGWLLARRAPDPLGWLRRCHLDDAEVIAIGPGARVRRLAWSDVVTITEERHGLLLAGGATRLRVPLAPLVRDVVLERVATALAGELWTLLDEGEPVRLRAPLDPALGSLAWWAWTPALAAVATGAGPVGLALAVGVAAGERALAAVRRRASAVVLDGRGVRVRRALVPWSDVEVMRGPHGLLVGVPGGVCGLVASGLANFWAVAPVIETKAQLGPYSATVHFRVRAVEDGRAVVGEVEPSA
jgi:hypothetical protein